MTPLLSLPDGHKLITRTDLVIDLLPEADGATVLLRHENLSVIRCERWLAAAMARKGMIAAHVNRKGNLRHLMLTVKPRIASAYMKIIERQSARTVAEDNTTVRAVRTPHGLYYEPNGRGGAYEFPYLYQRAA